MKYDVHVERFLTTSGGAVDVVVGRPKTDGRPIGFEFTGDPYYVNVVFDTGWVTRVQVDSNEFRLYKILIEDYRKP